MNGYFTVKNLLTRLLVTGGLLLGSLEPMCGQVAHVAPHPKLVVGIVIDQMRWDYLYRYAGLYTTGGFRRLMEQGFRCENTLLPYVPSYTGPGHTCIYTGSVPALHGIIANDWYDESSGKNIYCTQDDSVSTIGSDSPEGRMSPRNLWVTTIGDELRLSNNFQSRVIGISLKDRASILPAGHSANAAYWYDGTAGKWITSSYYMQALPAWVDSENARHLPDQYMSRDWNTLLPPSAYVQSTPDAEPYEGTIGGEPSPVFPHRLSTYRNRYEAFRYTPFAMTYTFDMARAAVVHEHLGRGAVTDLLAISISPTDYVGHTFGPNSMEAEDTYLRLDRDIAGFLAFLDRQLGAGNYLLFLTADHGVLQVPGFLKDHNIPSGNYSTSALKSSLNGMIGAKYHLDNGIAAVENNQVYISPRLLRDSERLPGIERDIVDFLRQQPFVADAFLTSGILTASIPEPVRDRLVNGYTPRRSGQVGFYELPGYLAGGSKGTTHGSWNPYDAHIPLIWFGYHITPGQTSRETYMTDIAATLAAMLHIQVPDGCVGHVIGELIK